MQGRDGRGRDGDPQTECDKDDAKHRCETGADSEHLFGEDQCSDYGHPEKAHDTHRKQYQHQAPTTAYAVEAVMKAHVQCTAAAFTPARQEEIQR